MGACHGQHPLLAQHILGQPLGAGHIGQALVENLLQQRIAARNGIADDEQVGRDADLRRIVTLDQIDALGFELGAHRRIDIGIATGHAMA